MTWRRLAATKMSSAVSSESPASPVYTNWMTISMTVGVTSKSRISLRRDSTSGLVNMARKYGLTAAKRTLGSEGRRTLSQLKPNAGGILEDKCADVFSITSLRIDKLLCVNSNSWGCNLKRTKKRHFVPVAHESLALNKKSNVTQLLSVQELFQS